MERCPWAWLASGDGWSGAGPAPARAARTHRAWGVRDAAIVERLTLRLHGDGGEADADAAIHALRAIDGYARRGLAVVGCWSFELGAALERLPVAAATSTGPQRLARFDDLYVLAFDPDALESLELPAVAQTLASAQGTPAAWLRQRAGFLADALRIAEAIAAGRVYQVNLTRALAVQPRYGRAAFAAAAPLALAALQASQPVPFASLLEVRSPGRRPQRLLSGSMELFLAADAADAADGATAVDSDAVGAADRRAGLALRTRPIKGTTPRGADADADAAARHGLQTSSKERAENAMIVDMARNDLSRVAVPGSVTVPTLLEPVAYQTLWHLESEVHARLDPSLSRAALFAATMPPASVSGAPKIAAMRTIVALERRRRGPYCGAIGVLWPDGSARLSVGIRVVLADATGAELAVGAGIVADSEPDAEWRELLLKAASSQRWLASLVPATASPAGRRSRS